MYIKKFSNIKKIMSVLVLIGVFVLGANVLYSWTAPVATPPNANAPAPINIGPNTQIKAAVLGIDGNLLVSGNSVFVGKVVIANGTHGAGKYLTSDADGNATWKTLP